MENQRTNDNDRCVLAAHPGKSQGRPPKQPELEAHRPQTACPTAFSVKAPVPVNRPYGRTRTATLKDAVSCPDTRSSASAPGSHLPFRVTASVSGQCANFRAGLLGLLARSARTKKPRGSRGPVGAPVRPGARMLVMASSARAAVPLSASRGTLTALAAAGLAFGLVDAAIILDSDRVDDRGFVVAVGLLVGWSFIGTGLFAWWRRPGNRTGALTAAAGFAWFCDGLSYSNDDAVFTAGIALDALFPAFVAHLLLAFPTGRLGSRAERVIVGAGYFVVTVLQVPSLLFEERAPGDPRNLLVVESDQGLSDLLDAVQAVAALAVIVGGLVLLAGRWRGAAPAQRTAVAPGAVDRRQRGRGLRGRDRLRCGGLDSGCARAAWAAVVRDRPVRLPRRTAARPAGRGGCRVEPGGPARSGAQARCPARRARGRAGRSVAGARVLAAGARALRGRGRPSAR